MEDLSPAPDDAMNEHAARGTRLHSVLEAMLRAAIAGGDGGPIMLELARRVAGDDWEQVMWCWSIACELVADPFPVVQVERRLDLSGLHPSMTSGTADLVQVDPWRAARITDWKFGSMPVSAEANLQLGAYALGIADEYAVEWVEVVIVQPMLERVSRATLGPGELEDCRAMITSVCDASARQFAPLITGPQCRYCDALATCPAAVEALERAGVRGGAESVADDLPTIGGRSLGELMQVASLAKAWAGAVQKHGRFRLLGGEKVNGWSLKHTKRRSWREGTTPADIREATQQEHDYLEAAKVSSPAQVEKLVGRSAEMREALAPLITHTLIDRMVQDEG